MNRSSFRSGMAAGVCSLLAVACLEADRWELLHGRLQSGFTYLQLAALVLTVLAASGLLTLLTHGIVALRKKPAAEAAMIGRLYWLIACLGAVLTVAYGFGALGTFGAAFSLFGGMLLGWSLQAPVSGFAAWVLVSLKRPFRPGDRVQFPSLNLTGDIKDIGAMYTVLNQVGGSIGSEEAVGRHILLPNAMLFGQVVINYTVSQNAAYMLDEVVVRITYDSDWQKAEEILLRAAKDNTADVIQATGKQPYIRADLYDYGVYLRLRYHTRATARAETAYRINRAIFREIQATPSVDIAIPYVYSYRAGQDRKDDDAAAGRPRQNIRQVPVEAITADGPAPDPHDVEQLARSIEAVGLLQPVILMHVPETNRYELLVGRLRLEACRTLGWSAVPAVVRSPAAGDSLSQAASKKPSATAVRETLS